MQVCIKYSDHDLSMTSSWSSWILWFIGKIWSDRYRDMYKYENGRTKTLIKGLTFKIRNSLNEEARLYIDNKKQNKVYKLEEEIASFEEKIKNIYKMNELTQHIREQGEMIKDLSKLVKEFSQNKI